MTATAVTSVFLSALGNAKLEPQKFGRPKAVAFLTYLLLEGRQNRQFMADLFWSDAANPLSSLRNQVLQLRPFVGDALVVSRQFIEFNASCDVFEMLQLLESGQLQAAIDGYQGDFLAGFSPPANSELELWLFSTRKFLKRHILEAHLKLAESETQQEPILAKAFLVLNPADHSLRRWLEAQVKELEQRNELKRTRVAPHNLPPIGNEFIGRNHEISAILERFQNQAQLITLLGFGGIGKTRLSLETARCALQLQMYLDGIYFVALETAFTETDLLTRLVVALQISIQNTRPLLEQIKTHIGNQFMLLLLDNLEQLTEQTPILAEILEHCPNLRLLCTSREVLGLSAEHVYPIAGLETNDVLGGAVQLFMIRAAQDFSGSEQAQILSLCQLLQGVPLAIELAVPQLQSFSLAQLQTVLEQSLDTLQNSHPDLPERQRSLRAVFLHSWGLLGQTESQALRRMAIFKNGANRTALRAVGEIGLAQIAQLIDKSLVQRSEQRYTIHPLILEYTLELLRADVEFPQILEQHAIYFLDQTAGEMPKIRGAEAVSAMQKIEADYNNLEAAWAWALEHQDFVRVAALEEMVVFFDQKALFLQGIAFFEEANQAFKNAQNQALLLSGIAIGIAWLHFRLGNAEKAKMYGEYAVEYAKSEPILGKNNLSKAFNILGNIASLDYEHTTALNYFEEAVRYCDADNLKIRKATLLIRIAGVYRELEDFEEFWNVWESAHFLNQELNIDNIKVLLIIEKANFLLYYVPREEITKFIPEMTQVYYSTQNSSIYSQPYFEILICQYFLVIEDLKKAEFWLQKFILRNISQTNSALYLFSQSLLGKIEMLKGNQNTAKDVLTGILFVKYERQSILTLFITLVNLIDLIPKVYRNDLWDLLKLVIAHKAMTKRRIFVKQFLIDQSLYLEIDSIQETSDQQIESAQLRFTNKLRTAIITSRVS